MSFVDKESKETLAGKTVLVTGASRGIGEAIALRFLREEANVVLFARDEIKLRRVASQFDGRPLLVVAGDINNAADRQRLVEETIRRFGSIHIFVSNAGVVQFASVEDTTEEVLLHHLNTNFVNAVALTRAIIPHLARRGSIVFVSTSITTGGFPGLAAYAASKAALEGFAYTLAVEVAPQDISVNVVAPGPTKSEMWQRALPPKMFEHAASQILPRLLPGEFGEAEQVANTVAFLTQNSNIRGTRLLIDGGYAIT